MPDKRPIVTLTTDFGEGDYFVGAMKGSILSINPEVHIVDLTHLVPAHDIFAAAFTLMCCYRDFPRSTLHMAIVDPGVGSRRRAILVMTDEYNFIGPDNGIFSYIYQRETVNRIVHLTSDHYFRNTVSPTFHGRDVFAPCAGYVTKGVDWRMMGEEVSDPVRFNTPVPTVISDRHVKGHVLHTDRFGNIITNITPFELTPDRIRAGARIRIGKHEVARVLAHFAEANKDELFAFIGSAGFVELAIPRQSAARVLDARRGMEVEVLVP